MTKTRPFLKWAGGKFRCIDTILASLPPAERLIEPFLGSGAVFLNATYDHYILAEQNQDLIHLYQNVQQEGMSFIDYCNGLFLPENNCKSVFYDFRDEFNQCHDKHRRAALFLYLNRHGYNGLCRYNQSGKFNVPFGSYIKPYFPRNELLFFFQKSKDVTFLINDFRDTFKIATPGDVIYCDPPYVPLSKSASFTTYTQSRFLEKDQIDLAELAVDSMKKGITVILSNHDTPFTRHHYQQAKIIAFPVKRHISCHSLNRQDAKELIAIFSP